MLGSNAAAGHGERAASRTATRSRSTALARPNVHERTAVPQGGVSSTGRCTSHEDRASGARDVGDGLAEAALRLADADGHGPAAADGGAGGGAVEHCESGRKDGAALPGLGGQGGRALELLGPLLRSAGAVLPSNAPQPVRAWYGGSLPKADSAAVAAARRALAADAPELVFARVYERLVRAADRRLLGTYFTPPAVVEFMIDRLAGALPAPAIVVDAGAGVGALTLAAQAAWPDVEVLAVDVNRASLGLLAIAAACRTGSGSGHLSLVLEDYLVWVSEWQSLVGPRALLSNPPYTRHQARTSEEKDNATRAAGPLMSHRTGSLSSYILAATWWRLGRADALCLVLPDNWLHAAYAKDLRRAIWADRQRRVDLYAMPEDESVFPDARVRAMVLVVWPSSSRHEPVTVHRTFRHDAVLTDDVAAADVERAQGGDPLKELWRRGIAGDEPDGVEAPGSLNALWEDRPVKCGPEDAGEAVGRSQAPASVSPPRRPLSDFVRLRRGIATGSNQSFLLRRADVAGVPPDRLRPAIHRLSSVQGGVLTTEEHRRLVENDRPAWLLDARPDDPDPAVRALLATAQAAGVPERLLCRRRTLWCALEFPDEPPVVLVSPSTNGDSPFGVVRNGAGAYITNNLFGASAPPGQALSAAQWDALTEWLVGEEAQAQWRRLARIHSGGLRKLEPKAARSLTLPPWLAEHLDPTSAG